MVNDNNNNNYYCSCFSDPDAITVVEGLGGLYFHYLYLLPGSWHKMQFEYSNV